MDLREATLKIAELSEAAREHRNRYKKQLEESEEHLNQVRNVVKEKQLENARITEVLEINNFTKSAFNDYQEEAKTLMSFIWQSLGSLRDTVSSLSEAENSFDHSLHEHIKRVKKMEVSFIERLKKLEIKGDVSKKKLSRESAEIQQKMKTLELGTEEENISRENAFEEYEKKFQAIKSEVEALEDTKEKESQQLELERKEIHKLFEEIINDDIEIRKRKVSSSLIAEKIEIDKSGAEIAQKRSEAQKTLEQIRQECANNEKLIDEMKNKNKQRVQNLTEGIELQHKLIEEKSSELRSCAAEIDDYNKEMEDPKFSFIDEEITSLQQNSTSFCYDLDEATENMNKIIQETERLKEESNNLETVIATTEENYSKKQKELDELKTTPNLELLEMKEELAIFKAEKTKSTEIEEIIAQMEQENKRLSQTIKQKQIALRNYTSRKIEVKFENKKKLKNITKQLEDGGKEHMEASQPQVLKALLKPPMKRTHQPPKTDPKKNKVDSGGDSTGYAEFLAKMKHLPKEKENKK